MHLQKLGYVVETLRGPWTCFDATKYGTLIVADIEDVVAEDEVLKIERDVRDVGLSVLVVADWFDEISLLNSPFYDDNTHSTWYPVTGGSNVPSLNRVLTKFGMELGVQVFSGWFDITPQNKVCM